MWVIFVVTAVFSHDRLMDQIFSLTSKDCCFSSFTLSTCSCQLFSYHNVQLGTDWLYLSTFPLTACNLPMSISNVSNSVILLRTGTSYLLAKQHFIPKILIYLFICSISYLLLMDSKWLLWRSYCWS